MRQIYFLFLFACNSLSELLPASSAPERSPLLVRHRVHTTIATVVATTIIWYVRRKIAVSYFFPLTYHVASSVFVAVNDVVLIDCVMVMPHDVFMADYSLCAGAGKLLAYYAAATLVASVCTIAVHHVLVSLFCSTCFIL